MQIHVCNVSIQTDLGKMSVVMSLRRVVIETLTQAILEVISTVASRHGAQRR